MTRLLAGLCRFPIKGPGNEAGSKARLETAKRAAQIHNSRSSAFSA